MDPIVAGVVIVLLGLVLCFAGIGSLHAAVLASGFGLGWLLADLFQSSSGTALLIGALSAVVAWFVVTFIFKFAAFFVGILTGAVIGAKIYGTISGDSGNWLLAVVLVVAVAATSGFLADRYRARALLWLTTIGGAGIVMAGLGRVDEDLFGFLRHPEAAWEQVVSVLVWVTLAVLGWLTQRRLFARRLRIPENRRD
ncbi:DUF4203 domain-containing protein [Oerskovia flava]|uniref:DUF4203 domain-containing protein n=1 Tax=Oerskovia flava TaxID=2986422 RepID=UPI002240B726|nr:DUF4203 domain-containing protein [Oerskovia sp. JB1-3-2]